MTTYMPPLLPLDWPLLALLAGLAASVFLIPGDRL